MILRGRRIDWGCGNVLKRHRGPGTQIPCEGLSGFLESDRRFTALRSTQGGRIHLIT